MALKVKTAKMKSMKKKAIAAVKDTTSVLLLSDALCDPSAYALVVQGKVLEEQRVKFEDERKIQGEKFSIQKQKVQDDLRQEINLRVQAEGKQQCCRAACLLLHVALERRWAANVSKVLRGWAIRASLMRTWE